MAADGRTTGVGAARGSQVLETRLGWVVQGTRDYVTLAESMCSRLELPIARDEDGWRRTLNRVQNAQVEAEVRGGGARGGDFRG